MRAEACVLTMSGVQGKRDLQVEDAMAGSQLRSEKLDLRLTPTAKQTLRGRRLARPMNERDFRRSLERIWSGDQQRR